MTEARCENWQDIETAPYNTVVIVKVGLSMEFEASLIPDSAMSSLEEFCDQWQAAHEGEHPPCWSGGCCWESNEDENASLQPHAWKPAPARQDGGK